PFARKMSATSTVGRLTLPCWVGGSACRPVRKSEEHRWDCGSPANDAEINGGRWSSPPSQSGRAKPGLFLSRFRVSKGELPNCDAACVEIRFSGCLHAGQLAARHTTLFSNRSVVLDSCDTGWEINRSWVFSTSSRLVTSLAALATGSHRGPCCPC